MAFSSDWRQHVEEAARRGADPLQSWDRAVDLGGNTLSGADAGMVGKYWAIMGGSRNEEWIRSNPTEFWQRQLRDAQNYFNNEMQHYGNVRSDIMMKEARQKEAELDAWKQQQQAQAQASTQQLQAQYEAQAAALAAQQAETNRQLQVQQQQAAQAAQQQEQQRAAEEAARLQQQQQEQWGSFMGSYNLSNVDDDKYAGEQSQASNYRSFLESQLGTAGYDAGSLLGGYDPTEAINAARRTTEGFETYKASLDPHVQQHGGYDQIMTQALGVQKQGSQQLSQYDQQIRDQLSGLGQAYQAYADLGNIQNAAGATGQEKIMSLFGFQRPDAEGIRADVSGIGSEYERLARETTMLYGGDTAKPQGQYQNMMTQWHGLQAQLNPAIQGLLSTYGSAGNTLYGMYGNLQDVTSGRIRSEASRQAGLLSQRSGEVSALTGQATQLGTRAQDTYNQTASRLRATRIAEGEALREQQAQSDFLERQNRLMGLAATTLQKPMERTQSVLRRVRPEEDQYSQDPLGLTRGYSSLLGG